MKLYTRGGDDGETSLFDGTRVAKDHPCVAAYGDVDELNSLLGWCRCAGTAGAGASEGGTALLAELVGRMEVVQNDLFVVGSHLATPAGSAAAGRLPRLEAEALARLERWIDEATGQVAPLRNFVLPAGSELAARLQVARTVCRRAERGVAGVAREGGAEAELVAYLNRLGDLLFAWARLANRAAGVADVLWVPKT